jgi:FkbM family methyltransferase
MQLSARAQSLSRPLTSILPLRSDTDLPASQVIDSHGLFRLHCENDLERYRSESLFTKEPETILWIDDCFANKEVFYDIGANIGIYTLFARARKGVSVYAFEPFLKNYCRLTDNIRLNGYTEDVTPLCVALSDQCGVSRFYSFDLRSGASGGQINEPVSETNERFDIADVANVVTLSIDALVRDFGLAAPNHVKIDVDGNEGKILAGMEETLSNRGLRSILIEVNPQVAGTKTIISNLAEMGFTTDNKYNNAEEHSRRRRKAKGDGAPENIIFTRP